MNRLYVCLAAIALLCFAQAQSQSSHVTKTELAKDNGKNRPGQVVKGFAPNDGPIHCVIYLRAMPAPTIFTGTLVAVEAGGVHNHKVASTNVSFTAGMNLVDFKFSLPRQWPVGSYKIEVKTNGTLLRDIAFNIK